MTNIIIGNSINKKQKRIVYIIMVSVLVSVIFVFLYIIFLTITSDSRLIILGDKTKELTSLLIMSVGAILGIPLGKKGWNEVYKKRKKGLILRVK